jgi:uncharacterized membrane protein YdbT with pleckstrin-like domain
MSHKRHQKYWQRFLLPNENIIHMFGVSGLYIVVFWILPAILTLILMLYLLAVNIILAFLVALIFLSVAVPAVYLRYFVHYAITDQRVMTREGILHKKFITADLPAVTDIPVKEKFFERVLTRTGEIGVNTAGSHFIELYFKHIKKPVLVRHDIYKHQNNWRARNGSVQPSNIAQTGR